jgi:MFS family permease
MIPVVPSSPTARPRAPQERPQNNVSRARLLALGVLALLSLVPVTLPVPVLREMVLERFSVSELATSTFMSINMVGAIIAAPIAGALSDRFGLRRPFIVGALLVDALCFWVLTWPVSFPVFMVVRFLEGCAHIFALSLVLAHASALATEGQRGRVMGMMGAGLLLGVALGAPLGGALGRLGPLGVLRTGVVLLLVTAALAAVVIGRSPSVGGHDRPGWREIVATLRDRPVVVVPLVYAFVDRFTVGFFTTTFSLYLKRIHDVSPAQVGMLLGAFMLPFALLSYPMGRLGERISPVRMLAGGSLGYGVATMTLGAWPVGGLPLLMLSLGILAAVMFVPSLLLVVDAADPRARATVLGAFNAAGALGFIVGPLVAGGVSQWVAASHGWETGYQTAFVVAGLSEVVCVVATIPWLRRLSAQWAAKAR